MSIFSWIFGKKPDETLDYDVQANDHIALLSVLSGYKSWQSLWNANEKLKAQRRHPFILFHGDDKPSRADRMIIPPTEDKKDAKPADAHHKYEIQSDKVFLRLRVLDDQFAPLKNARYTLTVDGRTSEADLAPTGIIEVEVGKAVRRGQLTITYTLPEEKEHLQDWPKVIQGTAMPEPPVKVDEHMAARDGKYCPFFCQADTGWRDIDLGVRGTSIRQKGCALCCAAMLLKYYGRDVDPRSLDGYLDKHQGYCDSGKMQQQGTHVPGNDLVWDVAFRFKSGAPKPNVRLERIVSNTAEFNQLLDRRLQDEQPTIVRVRRKLDNQTHFVVIVGKCKSGYLMNDPAIGVGAGTRFPQNDNILEKTLRGSGYILDRLYVTTSTYVDPQPASPQAQAPQKVPDQPQQQPQEQKPKKKPEPQSVATVFNLEIGRLNPVAEEAPDVRCTAGVQQRLNNIAYGAGRVDGRDELARTREAVRRFQRRFTPDKVTGDPRDIQQQLREFHDQAGAAPPEKA